MTRDELIVEIGRLIVADHKVSSQPWDQYALVVWHGDGVSKLNGFRYLGHGEGTPATPESFELEDRLDELREVTRLDGQQPWLACVVQLDRATGKATVDFEYDDAARWHVTPASAARVAARARPA